MYCDKLQNWQSQNSGFSNLITSRLLIKLHNPMLMAWTHWEHVARFIIVPKHPQKYRKVNQGHLKVQLSFSDDS